MKKFFCAAALLLSISCFAQGPRGQFGGPRPIPAIPTGSASNFNPDINAVTPIDFACFTPATAQAMAKSEKGGTLKIVAKGIVIAEIQVPAITEWTLVEAPVTSELQGKLELTFQQTGSLDLQWVKFAGFSAVNPPEGVTVENCVPGAAYPCVDEQSRATFALKAPQAYQVSVDVCGKVYPMARDTEGLWKITTDPLVVGPHYYQLIVDGVKINDPAVYTNYGCGSDYSMIEIPESPEVAAYYTANPAIPHGQVRECQYWSASHGRMRRCFVYTPAGYDNSKKKYPYFILQHGMAENEYGWHEQGKMANIMDNNIAAGTCVPMVVVMDNGDCDYSFGVVPGETQAEFGASFTKVVLDELIPYIESNFKVYNDKKHRAISGLSWGGHEAFEIGLRNTDKFCAIGAFSGAIFASPNDDVTKIYDGAFADVAKFNREVPVFFMSNGTEEGLGGMALDKLFDAAGVNYTRFVSEGTAHEWLTWRRSLNEWVKLIFKN